MNHAFRRAFSKILFGAYDSNAFEKVDEIDWDDIAKEVVFEIENNLFELSENSQRFGYLCSVFNSFFEFGIGHWLDKVNVNTNKGPDIDSESRYQYQCRLVMNWVVLEISRAATYYPGLDFKKVAHAAIIPKSFSYEVGAIGDTEVGKSGEQIPVSSQLTDRTLEKYLQIVEFYCKERKYHNKSKIAATKSVKGHFNIADKTLDRAKKTHKSIMDIYKVPE